jgi:hypothetical protein
MSKYSIGFAELYIPNYHDMVGNTRQYLYDDQQFLVVTQISTQTFFKMNTRNSNIVYLLCYLTREWGQDIADQQERTVGNQGLSYPYQTLWRMRKKQQSIIYHNNMVQDYIKVFNSKLCLYPQIIKMTLEPTGESLCTIHTSFLAIIQRKWKRYFKLLMQKIKKMKQPRNLLNRQLGSS